uniref:Uncharacterized protein n=1 Tax=Tetraselmis sp. GSL018 TaxID=582737 RepID=A0A061RKD4_9CHLO
MLEEEAKRSQVGTGNYVSSWQREPSAVFPGDGFCAWHLACMCEDGRVGFAWVSAFVRVFGRVCLWAPFPGLTTVDSFNFLTHAARLCKAGNEQGALHTMPLNLPHSLPPLAFFRSKEDSPAYLSMGRWIPYREAVAAHLPASPREVTGGKQQFKSCALVGDLGSLPAGGCGPEIDSHQSVWRFNLSPAAGKVAKTAGSKAQLRVLDEAYARLCAGGPSAQGADLSACWKKNGTLLISSTSPRNVSSLLPRLVEAFRGNPRAAGMRLSVIDDRFVFHAHKAITAFRQCLRARRGKPPSRRQGRLPSMELTTVLAALHLCGHVTLYGVGEPVPSSNPQSPPERSTRQSRCAGQHQVDLSAERSMLIAMSKAGMIRRCSADGCRGKPLPWQTAAEPGAHADGPDNVTDLHRPADRIDTFGGPRDQSRRRPGSLDGGPEWQGHLDVMNPFDEP